MMPELFGKLNLIRTGLELCVKRFLFSGGDPQAVFGLYIDDVTGVFAAVPALGWEPSCGVARALLRIESTLDGAKVTRVVGKVAAGFFVPLLGAFLPGIGKCHDVVDLNLGRGGLAANKVNGLTAIWIMKCSREDNAAVGAFFDFRVHKVAAQDVIAGIATVVAKLHGDVVAPRLAEKLPLVASLRCASGNAEVF